MLLPAVDTQIADTWGFAEELGCPHTDVVGVLISLEAEEMLKSKLLQTMYLVVSTEGQGVGGLPLYGTLPCFGCDDDHVW